MLGSSDHLLGLGQHAVDGGGASHAPASGRRHALLGWGAGDVGDADALSAHAEDALADLVRDLVGAAEPDALGLPLGHAIPGALTDQLPLILRGGRKHVRREAARRVSGVDVR